VFALGISCKEQQEQQHFNLESVDPCKYSTKKSIRVGNDCGTVAITCSNNFEI